MQAFLPAMFMALAGEKAAGASAASAAWPVATVIAIAITVMESHRFISLRAQDYPDAQRSSRPARATAHRAVLSLPTNPAPRRRLDHCRWVLPPARSHPMQPRPATPEHLPA